MYKELRNVDGALTETNGILKHSNRPACASNAVLEQSSMETVICQKCRECLSVAEGVYIHFDSSYRVISFNFCSFSVWQSTQNQRFLTFLGPVQRVASVSKTKAE